MRRTLAIAIAIALVPGLAVASPVETPPAPRVLNIPTARLQPSGRLFVSGGGFVVPDRTPFAGATLGLGGVADVDIELHDRLACRVCEGVDVESLASASAAFKMGVAEGRYARWQPAVALGLRAPIGGRVITLGTQRAEVRAARLFVMMSRALGPVDVHVGADIWDAEVVTSGGRDRLTDARLARRVRPIAGIEWTSGAYPRTRLLLDVSWAPVFAPDGTVALRWLAGWGMRYQALSWGSIELAVRHREDGRLDESEVTVRLNAVWDPLSRLVKSLP